MNIISNRYQKSEDLLKSALEVIPLGSQTFVPMKETVFLSFVAPPGDVPEINKIQSFIIPPKMGINYKPGIWHFPLISTEDTDFLVIDRKGSGSNIITHKFDDEKIILKYEKKIS